MRCPNGVQNLDQWWAPASSARLLQVQLEPLYPFPPEIPLIFSCFLSTGSAWLRAMYQISGK